MVRPHHKRRFVRGMQIVFALVLGVWLLEFLVKPGEAVFTWTALIALVSLGGMCLVLPWGFPGQTRENRWSRAADRAGTVLSLLLGALFLGAAVAWGIAGPTLKQFPAVSGVLLVTALVLGGMGVLLLGGLGVIGEIAQGNEETRRWAHSLGRTNDAAGSGPAQEDGPPL